MWLQSEGNKQHEQRSLAFVKKLCVKNLYVAVATGEGGTRTSHPDLVEQFDLERDELLGSVKKLLVLVTAVILTLTAFQS